MQPMRVTPRQRKSEPPSSLELWHRQMRKSRGLKSARAAAASPSHVEGWVGLNHSLGTYHWAVTFWETLGEATYCKKFARRLEGRVSLDHALGAWAGACWLKLQGMCFVQSLSGNYGWLSSWENDLQRTPIFASRHRSTLRLSWKGAASQRLEGCREYNKI